MSKSQLRKEYEARFGVVAGYLRLYDAKGNLTYSEESTGFWVKYEYDDKSNLIYSEHSDDYWMKYERDAEGNETYSENSDGFWVKTEYDAKGNQIYRESRSRGITLDKRNNLEGKIATIDGKEYKLTGIR